MLYDVLHLQIVYRFRRVLVALSVKMDIMNFYENGLNVQYVSKFIEKDHADNYFTQLKTLPFYSSPSKTRGRNAKSKRLVLGYGDEHLSYTFNGTSIPAQAWTPLMLELRDRVEKFAACSFNYVLLNLYPDGNSYITQHRDVKSTLDAAFPIVTLSFGAERRIEFKKTNTASTGIKLEHGSLYAMLNPTNKLFTHGISPEPNVKDMRISLTFHHLLTDPVCPPVKRPRLKFNNSQTVEENLCNYSKICERDISSTNMCEKDCSPSTNNSRDFYEQNDCMFLLLNEWKLDLNTFFKIVLDYNTKLRLHIRCFKEPKRGELKPTKEGITMTASTWSTFLAKIKTVKFESVNDSFVCNNQLLVAYIDNEFCLLQQIYPSNTSGFFLKPTGIKLFAYQFFNLLELTTEITESIIEALLTIQLPKLILNQPPVCFSHLNAENARRKFLDCICDEIITCTHQILQCEACLYTPHDENLHICKKPVLENFNLKKQEVLLNLNIYKIVKNLTNGCLCHYNANFFEKFDMKLYETCFEEILTDPVNKH